MKRNFHKAKINGRMVDAENKIKFVVKQQEDNKLRYEPTHEVNDQWTKISNRGVKCQVSFANGLIYVM